MNCLLEVLDQSGDEPGEVGDHFNRIQVTVLCGGTERAVPFPGQVGKTPGRVVKRLGVLDLQHGPFDHGCHRTNLVEFAAERGS